MIRVVAVVLVLLLVLALLRWVAWKARDLGRRSASRTPARRGHYDWERRRDQVHRKLKSIPSPNEDRRRILAFIESRRGVEALVEPRTMMHPLSVVLVAEDGEWTRIPLKDDAYLRELARTRGLRVQDAAKVGYPDRMRRYKKPPADGQAPEPRAGS